MRKLGRLANMRQLDDALGVGSAVPETDAVALPRRLCDLSDNGGPDAVAFAGKLPGGTGVNFLVGYNEAWFGPNYINYLASNPSFGPVGVSSSTFDGTFVKTMFDGIMANGGTRIVRIWVFTALQGIKLDPSTKTHIVSLTSVPGSPPGSPPEVIDNLQTVFNAARQAAAKHNGILKVYVTALNGGDMQVSATNISGFRQYFQNLLTNPPDIEAFKTQALLPLLTLLNANRDVIYAFDLINEIEAPLNSGYFSTSPWTSWTGARGWIKNMTDYHCRPVKRRRRS